jgi:ABC-2 type transport system ATP-binding protein
MIDVQHLSKRYGDVVAVDDVSFTVRPGHVTGFVGPNGAGKSTTMRMILGLDRPTSGRVLIGGRRYRDLESPLRTIGALLDASSVDDGRTAAHHLLWLADSNRLDRGRVPTVLELVGLGDVARRRVGTFSLGMRQRLGIAGALLGDPGILLFDEPANGLDPEGILWIRRFMQSLARQGRTVFVSSHLLSEMSQMADDLVVIGRGRLIAQGSVADFVQRAAGSWVFVRSPQAPALAEAVGARGGRVSMAADGRSFNVAGLDAPAVGELAAAHGMVLHELSPQQASLEEAFLQVTQQDQEYRSGAVAPSGPPPSGPPPSGAPPSGPPPSGSWPPPGGAP